MDNRDDMYHDDSAPPPAYYQEMTSNPKAGVPLMNMGDPQGPPQSQILMHPHSGEPVTVVTMASKEGDDGSMGTGNESHFDCCHLVCSLISVFICTLFGLIALVYALMGYTDVRTKNYARYISKKKCAVGWIVASWLCGAAVIGVYFYLRSRAAAAMQNMYNDGYN